MQLFRKRLAAWGAAALASLLAGGLAAASPALVLDADSGDVLYQEGATIPWYPASTTKLMTVYVALSAVREGRITLDTPLMVSPRAASMAPSKMGFRPGTLVTLDNALKMLMVKSPNDIAVTVAEGVSGSVENFVNEMNVYGTQLGLHESHFANPNGLPDSRHMSSARDMAMIARALLRDFPEERGLFSIGVLQFGGKLINNHNGLLGRYPGADGMKTGFTCAAGYNIVASADRNGRHLITVVMGAPSTAERNRRVVALFDRFFAGGGGSIGTLDSLAPSGVTTPPDNHDVACGRGRASAIAEADAEDAQIGPVDAASLAGPRANFEPVRVFVGPVPGWTGRVAQAVGSGSREYAAAPVRPSAAQQRAAIANALPPSPVEAAAPGPAPLALLGAAPIAPAAAATGRLVRAAPSLSLAVPGKRRAMRARHRVAPVTAELAKPSLIKGESTASIPAMAKVKAAAKPVAKAKAARPVAKAPAAKSAKAKVKPAKTAAAKP